LTPTALAGWLFIRSFSLGGSLDLSLPIGDDIPLELSQDNRAQLVQLGLRKVALGHHSFNQQ
jgi:hypothetical protein